MNLSRRERPVALSSGLVRTAPPTPRAADEPAAASISRIPAGAELTGSSGTSLSSATGIEISHDESGRAVVAFPPPPDVAARVPLTSAPMQISRQGFGAGMQMPALPQIPQAPAMKGLPQIPQGGMPPLPQIPQAPAMPLMPSFGQLGGEGGGKSESLATSSSSDASPTDQLVRQFKLDREQAGQVVDDLP
jgi:hypothetical protein